MADARQVFFLHLPKTAGISLRHLIGDGVPPERICPVTDWQGLKTLTRPLADYNLIMGHIHYAVVPQLRRGARVVTFLREPIARALSAFRHLERGINHPRHALVKREAPDLAAALRHPELRFDFLAPYTRFLGARARSWYRPRAPRFDQLSIRVEPDRAMLRRALRAVEAMDFVGITEDFAIDAPRCLALLGRPVPAALPRLNTADRPSDIAELPAAVLSELRDRLRFDLEVYEAAVSRARRDRASGPAA